MIDESADGRVQIADWIADWIADLIADGIGLEICIPI
jgi:hypothetical protein